MSFKYEVECTENVNMTSKDIPYYILRFTFPRSRQDRNYKDLNHFKSFPIEMELLCDNFILLINLQFSSNIMAVYSEGTFSFIRPYQRK